MRRKSLALLCLAAGAALVLAAAAAAGNGGFAPPDGESANVDRINDAYYMIAVFAIIILVGVESALLFFIVRFRRRGRALDTEGPQIRGHTRLELIWTVVPVVILAVIAAFVFYKLPGIQDVPEAKAGEQRLAIAVQGRQFYWEFRYPDGSVSVDELVVPVDAIVELDITAHENDVIHSWWVPQLGGKLDAIPGQTNETWFQARRAGTYIGQCAEFCGLQHAVMTARVRVVSQAEYEAFLAGRRGQLGAETYTGVCQKCHLPEVDYGPPLEGNPITGDAEQIRQIVTEGRGKMPAVGAGWPDEQLDALTKHLAEEVAPDGGES